MSIRSILTSFVLFALASPLAAANLTFRGYEQGDDVIFSIEGTLDLTGMAFVRTTLFGTGIAAAEGRYALGTGGMADIYSTGFDGFPAFGTGSIEGPGIGTGGVFSLTQDDNADTFVFAVTEGFISGSAVSETLRFENSSLEDLGVFAFLSADFDVTANQSYSVRIGNVFAPQIPLPATGLMLLGALGLGVVAGRRKS